jgi:hypothetical protein
MLRRHAPDVVSLVFVTLFAGFAVIWLLSATDVIDYKQAWLAGPAILIVAGVLGLLIALRPSRPAEPPPWTMPRGTDRDAATAPVDIDSTTPIDVVPTTPIDTEPDETDQPGTQPG